MTSSVSLSLDACVRERIASRAFATSSFFTAEAERIARLCHAMARRLTRGGRLLAIGRGAQALSDARHVAVEFVHPVIVGKRALPALALVTDDASLGAQVEMFAESNDMVMAFGDPAHADELSNAIAAARDRGALTIAFAGTTAEWCFAVPSDDPFIRQELVESLYHMLWELVHVFFEHPGLLNDDAHRSVQDASNDGAAGFLYPFLAHRERNLDGVLTDVAQSVALKATEISALRDQTLGAAPGDAARQTIIETARAIRRTLESGGTILALGNGGSATDAMDLVADYIDPPEPWSARWPRRRAIDLSSDTAILTALANDIGPDVQFSRQIIAHARPEDIVVAFSTSGGSRSVLHALEQARHRDLGTIAFVGYGGGRILSERLADHVIVSPSQHVPRIQEAQAAAHHIVRELVELANHS